MQPIVPDIAYHDRVLVATRPARASALWMGTVVARYFHPGMPVRYSVVLDAPSEDGLAIVDVYGEQLVVLPVRCAV